jgi:hypothetical protein
LSNSLSLQSQISSEDWARTFKFDDVHWPNETNVHSNNSLSVLASAAVKDVLSLSLRPNGALRDDHIPFSTMIFAVGGTASGKTHTIFGSSISEMASSEVVENATTNGKVDSGHEMGLLGEIMRGILSSRRVSGLGNNMIGGSCEPELSCSISILEIVNEDVLRDVLGLSNDGLGEHGGSKSLRVRHSDSRGATVLNLRQVPVDSIEQLHELLRYSFGSNLLRRAWSNEGGHGHFIVDVNVSRPNGGCAKIQLVDLASPDRTALNAAALRSVRKSLSALRGVLRGVAMQHASQDTSLKPPIPYRESTLTKLLQQSLDHQDGFGSSTRAVVIGTVRPSTNSYNQTLGTIDFMTRILAKSGETAHSPFRDAVSNKERQSDKVDGRNRKPSHRQDTENQHDSQKPQLMSSITFHPPTALLKSITSDPRQRLAKLVNSTPLSTKMSQGAVRINDSGSRDGGVFTENADCLRTRSSSYGVVLDQLNSLMVADENDLDRNDYGEGLIESLTPYKAKIFSDEGSFDSPEEPIPSPFRDRCDSKANDVGLVRLQQKNRLRGSNKTPKLQTAERHVQSEKSDLHSMHQNRMSSVASTISYGSDTSKSALFQNTSEVDPPRIILPLDSMDSEEPLVSSRGHDIFFGDANLTQKSTMFQLAKTSPTYEMFESFKQEIDTLVSSLTPRRVPRESEKMIEIFEGPSNHGHAEARRQSNNDLKFSLVDDKSASFRAKEQSLILEDFLSTIQSVLNEKNCDLTSIGVPSSWPQKYVELLSLIKERHRTLINIESQLESSKAQCVKLSSELNRAERKTTDLSLLIKTKERDLVDAQENNRSQAEMSSYLESQNIQLTEQLQDFRCKNLASSAFFSRLDDLLGLKQCELLGNDESRNNLRLGYIETLTVRIQDGLNRLKESTEREQQARNNVDALRSHMHEQQIREKELRKSLSQLEAKNIAAEKLAEEAISANENINNQLKEMRSKMANTERAYETLTSTHKSTLSENQSLHNEHEKLKSQAVEHEREIGRLNGALLASRREDELQRDLASFKAKTIAVMKQHMDGLKVDYARRLEDFKSSYAAEKESDTISLLQLDLSNRKGENEVLKRRIELLEQSTSSKLLNAEETLSRVRGELILTRDDASKQRDMNNKMQGELDHLRSLMDIAEESVCELNRLKEENNKLNETLRTHTEHDSRVSTADDDQFMHERISTLMRENEQNNISMRTLQAENVSLKSSIEQCTSTIQLMYSEMSDLKSIAIEGVSKLRTKEKGLLEEQLKSRNLVAEMENKLESANSLIRLLQSSSTGKSSIQNAIPYVFDRPKTPYSQSDNLITLQPPTGSTILNERQYAAELSTEKELRCKAEEICAGVLASSKVALEERDTEISKLRTQLFRLSSKR